MWVKFGYAYVAVGFLPFDCDQTVGDEKLLTWQILLYCVGQVMCCQEHGWTVSTIRV